ARMQSHTYPPQRRRLSFLACIAGLFIVFGFMAPPETGTRPRPEAASALPVLFTFDCIDGEPGDTVCIPVRVEDFNEIVIAQFEIIWNSTVLDYIRVQNPGSPSINVL